MLNQIINDTNWFSSECINAMEQIDVFRNYYIYKNSANLVEFTDGQYVLEFSYWPEDYPNLMLQTNIGILETEESVALWMILKMLHREDERSRLFRNKEELHNHLIDIEVDVFTKACSDIFNVKNIKRAYADMKMTLEIQNAEDEFEDLKLKVNSDFKAKNYSAVIKLVESNNKLRLNPRMLKIYNYCLNANRKAVEKTGH